MKKSFKIFLLCILLSGLVFQAAACEEVDGESYSYRDVTILTLDHYRYSVDDDDNVTFYGFDDEANREADVIIPEKIDDKTVRVIGKNAFQGDRILEKVTLPDTIERIEESAFNGCIRLTNVSFSNGLRKIGKGAFYNCNSLQNITLPESVEEIGDGAFALCRQLTSVNMSGQLNKLGKYAFYGSNLKSVRIPDSVKKIEGFTFARCELLEFVQLPEKLEEIGESAFESCSSLNHIEITAANIGKRAFASCGKLDDIVFADNVESIGDHGFSQTAITKINLPFSMTSISGASFADMPALESFEADKNTMYTVVDGVLFSADRAVLISYPAAKGEEIYEVPEDTLSIDQYAFYGQNLQQIIFNEGLKEIGAHACEKLPLLEIELPDSLKIIGERAFAYCENLTTAELSDSINGIDEGIFEGCSQLKELELPENLQQIHPSFDDNSGLEDFEISDKNKTFMVEDGVLFSKNGKKLILYPNGKYADSYEVPKGTMEICEKAFWGNKNLDQVVLPASVKTIGYGGLTDVPQVSFSADVKNIGEAAFGYEEEDGKLKPMEDFLVTCEEGWAIQQYARKNDIAYGLSDLSLNVDEISLKVDETFTLEVLNSIRGSISFWTSDENIVKVDQKGKITAVSAGNTNVIASVGQYFLSCKVNVTSESEEDSASESQESQYSVIGKENYKEWESGEKEQYDTATDNLLTLKVETLQKKNTTNDSEDPLKEFYDFIQDDINYECSLYELHEDTIMYCGANEDLISSFTGTGASLKRMKAAVGVERSFPSVMIFNLSHYQAASEGDYLIEIHAPAGLTKGIYMPFLSEDTGKNEFLLPSTTKYRIIGCGLREINVEDFRSEEKKSGIERYLQIEIIP